MRPAVPPNVWVATVARVVVAMSARAGSNGVADGTHGGALTQADDVRASSGRHADQGMDFPGRPDITNPTFETRGRLAMVASRSDESVPVSHVHAWHGNEAGCSTA